MKKLNWDKELKKVQKRGIYNPKVRVFSIIAIALLTLGIGLTFSAFSYSSGDVQAFNSAVTKKVKVVITVTNGSGSINTTTNYKSSGTIEYSVAPNSGYIVDESNTTCDYNIDVKKVTVAPTADINCKVVFKQAPVLNETILSNNDIKTADLDFSVGEPSNSTSAGSGLYKTIDNDGDTFYFRGEINNNYVKFANSSLMWRIVRINGDGSIRLILNENAISGPYNTTIAGKKYVGYTYDNNTACTKANPCISNYNIESKTFDNSQTSSVNSSIKNSLESWYVTNMINYDKIISLSSFCNDTSIYKDLSYAINYNADNRWRSSSPTLKCEDTTLNYGGVYKLKIGLITLDELMFAGYGGYETSNPATSSNYLYVSNNIWTMTPWYSDNGGAAIFTGYKGYFWSNYQAEISRGIRPVINIKSTALLNKDNQMGTIDNPYVILNE